MNLLETNFIQSAVTAPYKIQLTGEECDASKMSLSNLNEEALLRMHLFIRLWRKLGWSMPDLDRAISAFPIPLNTSTNNLPASSGFKPAFLIFLANVDRLRQQKGLAIGILLNWYSSRLSTQQYADFSKSGSRILPSTYESLFYDRSVSRPKDPAFELNTNRDGLIPSAETIRSKISVIAAAFAIRPNQIEALLPPAIESLSLAEYYENTDGISVGRNGASGRVIGSAQGNKGRITVGTIIELDLRSVRGTGVNAIVKLQHADITTNPIGTSEMIRTSEPSSPQFIDIPLADLNSEDQPDPITNSTTLGLRRFLYTGTKPLLRIAITDITGTVSLAAKVILAPRVSNIGDSLSLENLGALSRYTSLAKSLRLSIQEFLLAINLTGINPFSSPEQTLKLMDYLQLI